nr:unnamed protein product [Callosobruchus analis]
MKDSRTVLRLINKGTFMASIDLKDAYLLVPIKPTHRRYLNFRFQNHTYEFQVLPLGLSSAPYVFTKIMKPVTQKLRSLDIITDTEGKVRSALHLLRSLGFLINIKKSNLVPTTRYKFLGLIFDSVTMNVEITPERKQSILKWTQYFLKAKKFRIRNFAQLLGLLEGFRKTKISRLIKKQWQLRCIHDLVIVSCY